MSCDPNFADVSLLLAMAGANGSTTFVDTSNNAYTVTSVGGVEQSNAVTPEFGATCGYFPGSWQTSTDAYLSVPITPGGPLDFSQGPIVTFEGWVQIVAPVSPAYEVICSDQANGSYGTTFLAIYGVAFTGNCQIGMTVASDGFTTFVSAKTVAFTPDSNWHHVAGVIDTTNLVAAAWIDGVCGSVQTLSAPITYTAQPTFGIGDAVVLGNPFTGYMQQVRITKGLARYTPGVNFTPPSAPFGLACGGGATVPDVTNLAEPIAAGVLTAAGFVVGTITSMPSGTIIAGNVASQSPVGGSSATAGSAVNLVLSSGLPALTVPDLYGMDQADAVTLLLSLGFAVGPISSAPSNIVPANEVQTQNPSPGTVVAQGTIVSFVLSLGIPATGTLFDFEATVISQYANSPTIIQLVENLNEYIDQSANFANFYNYVWNVDTATGFGLDIWGTIVNVSRLLVIPNTTEYVGFYQPTESQPAQDWTPAGSDQPPYNDPPVGGAFYTGYNATNAYLLPDDAYRQLILAKAFANICTTTAPAINQILQNLYGAGTAFVLQTGRMAISYNLTFTPTAIQLAILEQSGVIPTPPAVSVVINTGV